MSPSLAMTTVPLTERPGLNPLAVKIAALLREFECENSPSTSWTWASGGAPAEPPETRTAIASVIRAAAAKRRPIRVKKLELRIARPGLGHRGAGRVAPVVRGAIVRRRRRDPHVVARGTCGHRAACRAERDRDRVARLHHGGVAERAVAARVGERRQVDGPEQRLCGVCRVPDLDVVRRRAA